MVLASLAIIFIPMLLDNRAVEENLGAVIPSRDTGPFNDDLARQAPAPIARLASEPAVAAIDPNVLPPTAAGVPSSSSPEVDTQSATPALRAWVVQVGSYGQQDNADGVAARLRTAGFDTVIEKAQVEGQPVYRVQVGPESSQARADALRQRISDTLKLDGTVVQHPAG